MARIRTIKPEFPQSETVGRLSREARLLFILIWTIVDDEGRTRASSRMLASLLYPYDDDAPKLIDGWMAELEQYACVWRYEVEGSTYLQVNNWLKHQKIDRPTPSRLPRFEEQLAINREPSRDLAADLGPRTVDQGPKIIDNDGACAPSPVLQIVSSSEVPKKRSTKQGTRLTAEWLPSEKNKADAAKLGLGLSAIEHQASKFRDYWLAKTGARATSLDWDATWRNWCRNCNQYSTFFTNGSGPRRPEGIV